MTSSKESSQATAVSVVRLRPVLPSYNDKYSGPLGSPIPIQLERDIPPLSLVLNLQQSVDGTRSGWIVFTHPEGDKYFWNETLKVVTSIDPHHGDLDSIIRTAKTSLDDLARTQSADIQDAEAFLFVAAISASTVDIDYYMIDHNKSVPFWLQQANVDRELPGLQPYESEDHLRLALRAEYWAHLENFPSHRAVIESAVDELTCLLVHSGTDDMTSQSSVSPWGAEECLRFLGLFSELKGKEPNPFKTATVARMWSTVYRVRYLNRYGLPGPRLDRLQGLETFIAGQLKNSAMLSIAELLCFNIPQRTFYQLSELWNGRIVYIRHWDRFLEDYRQTCIRMACVSGGITSLATVLLPSQSLNHGIAAAATLGSGALFASLYLYDRHSSRRLGSAMDVSAYLSRIESFQHGLRPFSILLSLPQALTIWAGLMLQIALIFLAKPMHGPPRREISFSS